MGAGAVGCWVRDVDALGVVGAAATVDVLVRGAGPLAELQFTGPADDVFVVLITHDRETVTRTASTGRFWANTGEAATAINPRAAIAGACNRMKLKTIVSAASRPNKARVAAVLVWKSVDIDFSRVFIQFSVLVLSLTFHEAAHAWSANRLGDATARLLGRVSLNPAVHIDPIGTIAFPLIAMLTNLPIIGWAKPVPVNILNLRHHWKRKYMVIAAAGPVSNLLLATVAAVGVRLMGFETSPDSVGGPFFQFLLFMVLINVLLAVFNMVPVPPLDGGNVLAGLLPGQAHEVFDYIRPYGFLILYGLLLSGILWRIVNPIQDVIVGWLL